MAVYYSVPNYTACNWDIRPLNRSPFNHNSPPLCGYPVVPNWHTIHALPAAIIQRSCLTRLHFSHGNFCQKKFLAYKSIRVIRGHKPQVNLLYNVTLHSTLSRGPSCILHWFADTDNGTGDQTHRIPHNANPDVASVIASCRPGLEGRGGQITKYVKINAYARLENIRVFFAILYIALLFIR